MPLSPAPAAPGRRGLLSAALAVALAAPSLVPLAAQERVDADAVSKLRAEGFERSQIMEISSWLTDVYGSRLTNAPSTRAAADWTVKKLGEWGLSNPRLEKWGPFGVGWSNERTAVHVVSPTAFPIIAYPSAWSPGTKGAVRGEVVLFSADSTADFEKYRGKLRGRVVLSQPARELAARFDPLAERYSPAKLDSIAKAEPSSGGRGGPDARERRRLAAEAARAQNAFLEREGALAVLLVARGDGGTVFTNNGSSRNPDSLIKTPTLHVAAEHYGRLVRMVEKGVPVTMELDVRNTYHRNDLSSYNIVAEIPGSDPALKDEVVMLGAHFDSWHSGTGATDNAAGSAVMMEAVRLLQATGMKPRRTVRIALWTGEEQGLLGSRAYVREKFGTAEAPKPANEKVSAYFNLDNGTGAIRGVYMQGNEAVRPIFQAWLAPFRDRGATTLTLDNTGGTDHLAFDDAGIPGFQFIQDPIEYGTRTHHSNMDTFERLQAEDMKHNAVVVATFVLHAANRDQKLPRKPSAAAANSNP